MPISASVGAGGRNQPKDVVYIQFLLSDWRSRRTLPEIDIDGVYGPETGGAIADFQSEATTVSDDRIDPNGPTLRALEQAHLDGVLTGSWVGAAQLYGRAVPRNPVKLAALSALYLRILHDGDDSNNGVA